MEEKKTQVFEAVKSLRNKGIGRDKGYYIAQADGLLMGYAITVGITFQAAMMQYNEYNRLMRGY